MDCVRWHVNIAVYFQIPLDGENKESVDRHDKCKVVENMLLHGVASLVYILTYHIIYLLAYLLNYLLTYSMKQSPS